MIIDGERIKELVSTAKIRVVLCAPFIKVGAFRVVMSAVPKGVHLEIVTRWRPEEVAAGVSDLGVYDWAITRENTSLKLSDALHAKLYVSDDKCLVGSANLTGAALGWSDRPNIEVLVPATTSDAPISQLLSRLAYAEPATLAIRDEIAALAASIRTVPLLPDEPVDVDVSALRAVWLPRCAAPEKLFSIYRQAPAREVGAGAAEDGAADIKDLGVPDGLEKDAFYEYVSVTLDRFPAIAAVLNRIPGKLNDADGIRLVHELHPGLDSDDAGRQWHILREWIREFYASRFEVAPESFVLRIKS